MGPDQEGDSEKPSTLAHLDSVPCLVGLRHQSLPQRDRAGWLMLGLGGYREECPGLLPRVVSSGS